MPKCMEVFSMHIHCFDIHSNMFWEDVRVYFALTNTYTV